MEVVIGGTDGPVQVTLRPSPPFASPAECHPRPQQRSPSTSAIRLANPEPPAREVYFGFNQALVQAVRDALEARGVTVVMIPGGDLRARAAAARGADLLLSIHHDSVQPRYLEDWQFAGKQHRMSDRFSGYSVFVSRSNPHRASSLRFCRHAQ